MKPEALPALARATLMALAVLREREGRFLIAQDPAEFSKFTTSNKRGNHSILSHVDQVGYTVDFTVDFILLRFQNLSPTI